MMGMVFGDDDGDDFGDDFGDENDDGDVGYNDNDDD